MKAIPKPKRIRDEKYLKWIRTLPCLASGELKQPCGEAHHVLPRGGGKVGSKTDDRRAVPLCRVCHEIYHENGREYIERNIGLDLEAEIKRLNREYDQLQKPRVERRKPSMKVRFKEFRVNCECGREHAIPRSKALIAFSSSRAGVVLVSFTCVTKNERKEVQI